MNRHVSTPHSAMAWPNEMATCQLSLVPSCFRTMFLNISGCSLTGCPLQSQNLKVPCISYQNSSLAIANKFPSFKNIWLCLFRPSPSSEYKKTRFPTTMVCFHRAFVQQKGYKCYDPPTRKTSQLMLYLTTLPTSPNLHGGDYYGE